MNNDLIFQLVNKVIALLILIYYFDIRFKKKSTVIVVSSVIIYVSIQIIIVFFCHSFPYVDLLFNVPAVAAFGIFSYIGNRKKIILSGILYCVLFLVSEIIAYCLLIFLKMQWKNVEFIGSVLTELLLLVMVKIIHIYFYSYFFLDLHGKYNVFILLFPITSIFIIISMFYLSNSGYWGKMGLILGIAGSVILAVNIFIIKLYDKLVEELKLINLNYLYEKQLELCKQQVTESEEYMLLIRSMRHDMKNDLVLIREMLENGNIDKAQGYIDSLILDAVLMLKTVVNTGNVCIDALLNLKQATAKRYEIDFKTDVIVPYSLPFKDGDICMILGNILDNSIVAAAQANQGMRYIKLTINVKRSSMVIILKNTFCNKNHKNMRGTAFIEKYGEQQHEFGLSFVNRAVEKYNGTMKTEYTDFDFTITIILFSSFKERNIL